MKKIILIFLALIFLTACNAKKPDLPEGAVLPGYPPDSEVMTPDTSPYK